MNVKISLTGLTVALALGTGLPPAQGATVYTNEADFVQAIGALQSFLNNFDDLTASEWYVHPLIYSSNGLEYAITSIPYLYIFSLVGAVSTEQTNDIIEVSMTSTNVRMAGGWFYLTDTNGNPTAGTVTVALSDGTTNVIASSTNAPVFRGYVSSGPILTNLAIQSDTAGGFPTLDHYYVAEGEPTFAAPVIATNTMILSWPAPATGYVLQSATNLLDTNWTAAPFVPQDVNDQWQVAVPLSGTSSFYRLIRQ
jgi:hypothetical protein